MYAILLLCLIVTTSIVLISADCPVKCEWLPWEPWLECSRICAGGIRWRFRPICCRADLASDIEACMTDCKYDSSYSYSGHSERGFCNQFCYNGGSFIQQTSFHGICQCHGFTYGVCCENGTYFTFIKQFVSTKNKISDLKCKRF